MSLRSVLHQGRALSARVARALLGVGLLGVVVGSITGIAPLSSIFVVVSPEARGSLGTWWLKAFSATFVCYVLTSITAVVVGAILGGLTSRRRAQMIRPTFYNGAIRRGLELTGALPAVILCAIWSSTHPGQTLPALLAVTLVQQVFEIGARVKSMIETPNSSWNELWSELWRSAAHVATTLASGEIALVVLRLAAPNYGTWPSSAASYLYAETHNAPPSLLWLSLLGTIALPACLLLAGPIRPAAR